MAVSKVREGRLYWLTLDKTLANMLERTRITWSDANKLISNKMTLKIGENFKIFCENSEYYLMLKYSVSQIVKILLFRLKYNKKIFVCFRFNEAGRYYKRSDGNRQTMLV